MISVIIAVIATLGTLFVLLAAVGILRMPDTYLRMAVTTKAATLGIGLILIAAAIYFYDFSTTTRVLAIILFILLTAPVGAHLIGKASYISGNKLWEGSIMDDLKGKYRKTGKHVSAPKNPEGENEQEEEEI
ncbi:multisubunit sodium/proton antiporter, MrpG subunit [Salinimicrobium catena]|uniref:Multisubunit sodium/proton antiporter, MrpG subunit n=1 Tax=Salinimicrobium catena TaxID=390640 RepID=A0A1H5JCW5_9FLAO|nr:monovalent cation/H(+) antiporter subunit G [Salinimicrobium catena]SDK86651.1 multicomponent Na+:H+ antiporter subunit G [Salinimicrobium catena]SEE50342.1 multisubunit sodium/proton antiporter, MrpG subunit [Salinimicrobium catena]